MGSAIPLMHSKHAPSCVNPDCPLVLRNEEKQIFYTPHQSFLPLQSPALPQFPGPSPFLASQGLAGNPPCSLNKWNLTHNHPLLKTIPSSTLGAKLVCLTQVRNSPFCPSPSKPSCPH